MVEHFQAHISLAQGASSSSGCGATASGTGNGQQLMFALSCTQARRTNCMRARAHIYVRPPGVLHIIRVRNGWYTQRCVCACAHAGASVRVSRVYVSIFTFATTPGTGHTIGVRYAATTTWR